MIGFDKQIPFTILEYETYDAHSGDELRKVANAAVDVPEGFVFDPDYLYLWVRIISAGEYYGPNKNGDYFPEKELLQYYNTFKTGHVFKNHENKKVEHAIGEIISVRWNPVMKCVEIFKGIDRKRAPEVARGFLKGYLTDVSMGCKVPYTICSACGNKARRKTEFCVHINEYRMQYLGNGERVFEINFEPNFHDSSTVLTGAERVAKAQMIIDAPPEGVATFQKAASAKGVTRYVKLSDQEMQKVASARVLHPILQPEVPLEKQASGGILQKLAELEKELSGKVLNLASAQRPEDVDTAAQIVHIVRFLGDRRFDDDTIKGLADTMTNLALEHKVSTQKVFTLFLSLAELMGVELYPSELHKLLRNLTDAGLNDELELSEPKDKPLYPSEYADGMNSVLEATKQLPEFDDPSGLMSLYDEGAHRTDELTSDPLSFLSAFQHVHSDDDAPPVHIIRVIRHTLSPFMPMRSSHPEHLLPRLAATFSGFSPMIGSGEARGDFDILANPRTIGDALAGIVFRNYQRMRPGLVRTQMVRLAMSLDGELEKVASVGENLRNIGQGLAEHGIKRRHLLIYGAPAIYGASLFQKTRRDHGRNLSDVDNFVADHPGIITGGVVLAGKPLTRAISHMFVDAGGAATKAGHVIAEKVKTKVKPTENFMDVIDDPDIIVRKPRKTDKPPFMVDEDFEHLSSVQAVEPLMKLADTFPHGTYDALGDDALRKFAEKSGLSSGETAALKVATLFSLGGMNKEAQDVLEHYALPEQAKGLLLKFATEEARSEMDKAANDFFNNLLLDGMISNASLPATLPGRMVDAFVVSRLTKKLGEPQTPPTPKEGE